MPRDIAVIESEKNEEASRLKRLNTELEGLKAREDSDPGVAERISNVKRAVQRGTERVSELILEHRDVLSENIKSGRYGFEAGYPGGEVHHSESGSPVVDSARRRIDGLVKSRALPDHAATAAERLLSQSRGTDQGLAARWALATADDAYMGAFVKLLADPSRGHLLWTGHEQDAYQKVAHVASELKASALSPDSAGGFMVPFTLDPAIMLTSGGSANPLRRISRVVQTVTDQWAGVTSAGITAEWKAEAAEVADASPTLAQPNIPVHFGDAFVPYSFEIGMDGVNFVQEMSTLLVDAADQHQATAFTTGTGTAQPKGVITALAGTTSEINGGGTETLTAVDAYTIQNALPPRFQARAQWCANLAVINQFAQFETAAGALKFPEIRDGRLLNRPLNELSNMDSTVNAAATENNFLLLYGDFSNFVIVDRIGTFVEPISNLFGPNRRPTGQRGLLMWFRTGSDVVIPNAFRMLDVPTTA